MSDLACLELSVVLWLVHIILDSMLTLPELGSSYLMGPRDEDRPVKGVYAGRAARALKNYLENYTPFVALDLGLIATGHNGGLGATIWIIARVLYIPCYVLGITYARSAAWGLSIVGLLLMLKALAGL